MKKLMIAAAIVCAAAFAQASSANWGFYEGYAMGTSDYATGYVTYFFDSATVSQSDVTTALGTGSTAFIADALDSNTFDEFGMVGGEATVSYVGGESMTAYAVVFNAATAGDATYAFITDEVTASLPASGVTTMDFDFPAADTEYTAMQTASNWTKIGEEPIPEPTSGLLMLLGMGALALRRRRA